jgi:hypothetical protein
LLVQTLPEGRHAIGHFVAVVDEGVLADFSFEVQLFEFLLGVPGVLGFQAAVPGEERKGQIRSGAGVVLGKALDELVPEAGGGPVLHGVAGGLGSLIIRAAIETL